MHTEENNNSLQRDRKGGAGQAAVLWVAIGASLAGLAGVGFGISSRNEATRAVQAQQASVEASRAETLRQMQSLEARLADFEKRERERAAAPPAVERAAAPAPAAVRRARPQPAPRVVEDPRIKQLEKKFSEHDEKLATTQQMVESTRSELEGRINSSSDELKGSIAKTSEEVAALRRRGERDYFEFDILKSKTFQRVGPLSVALRKADVKHKRFNLEMIVDDNKLEKKNVNLYEPLYLTSPEWPQPLELVVNRVTKDRVSGYISAPKYKKSELASGARLSEIPKQ